MILRRICFSLPLFYLIAIVSGTLLCTGCGDRPLFSDITERGSEISVFGKALDPSLSSHIERSPVLQRGTAQLASVTPYSYKVALSSLKLCTGIDDTDPWDIFDYNLEDAVDIAIKIGRPTEIATNEEYPLSGQYDYIECTLLFIEQTVLVYDWPNAGTNSVSYRVYFSNIGLIQQCDLLRGVGCG